MFHLLSIVDCFTMGHYDLFCLKPGVFTKSHIRQRLYALMMQYCTRDMLTGDF